MLRNQFVLGRFELAMRENRGLSPIIRLDWLLVLVRPFIFSSRIEH
jgi:hypothetical protein